jgi:ribosome-binding protein aMBF1 (putative translation factor)
MKLANYVTPEDVLELLAKEGDAVDREFASAALLAKKGSMENGLAPKEILEGEFKYSVQQGLKAAGWAREDAAAVLILQPSILRRLDALRRLLLLVLALLAYIAYRLS